MRARTFSVILNRHLPAILRFGRFQVRLFHRPHLFPDHCYRLQRISANIVIVTFRCNLSELSMNEVTVFFSFSIAVGINIKINIILCCISCISKNSTGIRLPVNSYLYI